MFDEKEANPDHLSDFVKMMKPEFVHLISTGNHAVG